jgi:hypothetical protein
MTAAAILYPRRELARRVSGGIEVALFWSPHDNSTTVEVWQSATKETLLFTVARADALDAFYHPFAHLPTTSAGLVPARD